MERMDRYQKSPVRCTRLRFVGAENGIRTRDLNLGKVALYQLSYFRDISRTSPNWDCKYKGIFGICKILPQKIHTFAKARGKRAAA